VQPDYVWPAQYRDTGLNQERLQHFLKSKIDQLLRSDFTTPENLAAGVAADLARELNAARPLRNRAAPVTTANPTASAAAILERLQNARSALGLEGHPTLMLGAASVDSTQIQSLFGPPATPIVQLIEHPLTLRQYGFDLTTESNSSIVAGQSRRIIVPDYKLLEVHRDGLVKFVADGGDAFLCWNNPFGEKRLKINPLVMDSWATSVRLAGSCCPWRRVSLRQ